MLEYDLIDDFCKLTGISQLNMKKVTKGLADLIASAILDLSDSKEDKLTMDIGLGKLIISSEDISHPKFIFEPADRTMNIIRYAQRSDQDNYTIQLEQLLSDKYLEAIREIEW